MKKSCYVLIFFFLNCLSLEFVFASVCEERTREVIREIRERGHSEHISSRLEPGFIPVSQLTKNYPSRYVPSKVANWFEQYLRTVEDPLIFVREEFIHKKNELLELAEINGNDPQQILKQISARMTFLYDILKEFSGEVQRWDARNFSLDKVDSSTLISNEAAVRRQIEDLEISDNIAPKDRTALYNSPLSRISRKLEIAKARVAKNYNAKEPRLFRIQATNVTPDIVEAFIAREFNLAFEAVLNSLEAPGFKNWWMGAGQKVVGKHREKELDKLRIHLEDILAMEGDRGQALLNRHELNYLDKISVEVAMLYDVLKRSPHIERVDIVDLARVEVEVELMMKSQVEITNVNLGFGSKGRVVKPITGFGAKFEPGVYDKDNNRFKPMESETFTVETVSKPSENQVITLNSAI